MLPAILGILRPPPGLAQLGGSPGGASPASAVAYEELCWPERSEDGHSTIVKCRETRRVLQRGIEVEVQQTTSTRPPDALAAVARAHPPGAPRWPPALGAPPAADAAAGPPPLDALSGQMLDEIFAFANELERGLSSRGAMPQAGGAWRQQEREREREREREDAGWAAAGAPEWASSGRGVAPSSDAFGFGGSGSGTSTSGSGGDSFGSGGGFAGGASGGRHHAGGAAVQPQAGLLRRWFGRAGGSEAQQQQQQQQPQAPSLGAIARAQGADVQSVL